MKINILDQSPITEGQTPGQAIKNTLELAQGADKLGYHRFWVAEHHNSMSYASPTPEILIPHLASLTSHMRIGSGGVMLGHYSPLKVAEQFNMLENLFPNRIDLGLGRASGAGTGTTKALEYGVLEKTDPFEKMLDLISFIDKSNKFRYGSINAMPLAKSKPEFWILGSSLDSALFAAKHGLAYSFAYFIKPKECLPALQAYQKNFVPSPYRSTPYASAAIFALCASTQKKACDLAKSAELWAVRTFLRKDSHPFPKNEEALSATFRPLEKRYLDILRSYRYVGSPEEVKTQLEELQKQLKVDEITIVTLTDQFKDRLESYRLIAKVFDL